MFDGTETKDSHCRRCTLNDARRRFLNGEGYERVRFGEIDVNSRAPSPGGCGNGLNNHTNSQVSTRGLEGENKSPERIQVFEEQTWLDANNVCKNCSHHHKAYSKKMEHSIQQRPTRFKALEDNDFGRGEHRKRGPRKTRRAPPKEEIWAPDAMRGLKYHSPSQMGGRNVLTPSQRFRDKWDEEHLSLRFSNTPQTECAHCLHHHGIDIPQPDPDAQRLERLISSFPSKKYLEAEESLHRGNGGAWWGNSEEERNCRRCSSHHITQEGLLNLNEEVKRMNKQLSTLRAHMGRRTTSGQQRMAPGRSRSSSPEFSTPPGEFPRSRTPTPQRSHNYREIYERKVQARSKVDKIPNFELQQLWKQSGNMPKYGIAELRKCRVPKLKRNSESVSGAWLTLESSERRQNSPGGLPQYQKSPTNKGAQSVKKGSKSPNWSKECLHKRELRRRIYEGAVGMLDTHRKGSLKNGTNRGRVLVRQSRRSPTNLHGKPLTRRMLSLKSQMGNCRGGKINRSRTISLSPNLTRVSKNNSSSKTQLGNKMRAKTLEEQESRWAPPVSWTTRQLNFKEVKQRSVSPNRCTKVGGELLPRSVSRNRCTKVGGELLPRSVSPKRCTKVGRDILPPKIQPKIQALEEDMNCKIHVDLRDSSRKKTSQSRTTSPSRMQPIEMNSKVRRQPHSLHELVHEEKSNIDCHFEVLSTNTRKLEERDPNCSRPNSCRTRNSSSNPRHIFLRITKNNADNVKDQTTNSEIREKSPMSKKKFEGDMKMRIQIDSEMPLDLVDGRLKQFLNGVGGLIHYSPKDGGVPRIKELANYFSGKQPLLWFFPRST